MFAVSMGAHRARRTVARRLPASARVRYRLVPDTTAPHARSVPDMSKRRRRRKGVGTCDRNVRDSNTWGGSCVALRVCEVQWEVSLQMEEIGGVQVVRGERMGGRGGRRGRDCSAHFVCLRSP
eukprot:2258650-Rhodomonas_salina.1